MAELPFSISLDLAGQGIDAALKDGAPALAWLRAQAKTKSLELLGIADATADIEAARPVAAAIAKDTSDIVVLGIGGSSLGGKALMALADPARSGPRVSFHDNPDPETWSRALAGYDLKTTRFAAISKSGGTAETLMQVLTAADAIEKAGGGKYLKYHFAVVTEPKPSPLRAFADSIGAPSLDHPLGIGGRYSVLSVVGVLPALILGLDVAALRAGAKAVLEDTLASDASGPLTGAMLHYMLAEQGRMRETVLWSYADKLATLGAWWRQLWAESLGKDGKGSTPVAAIGPVDQHSQLQHFRDGPNDTLYTLVSTDTKGRGPAAPRERAEALGLGYLAGRTVGDLVDAEARATAQTLARNGRPVRTIHVPKIDERAFGGLMMHFMLETILMGRLMGVDPFDQPGVEEGKVLAREYLAR
jgi:glucose-6-phosphate isomerase